MKKSDWSSGDECTFCINWPFVPILQTLRLFLPMDEKGKDFVLIADPYPPQLRPDRRSDPMNRLSRKKLWIKPLLCGLVGMGFTQGSGLLAQNSQPGPFQPSPAQAIPVTAGANAGTAAPRFALVGFPTPIATSTPQQQPVDNRLGGLPSAPRTLDLDGPPVITTTNPVAPAIRPSLNPGIILNPGSSAPVASSAAATSPGGSSAILSPMTAGQTAPVAQTATSIIQAQSSMPINGNSPVNPPSIRTYGTQPVNGSNAQPYTYAAPAPASRPSLFSNLGNGFNKPGTQPFQTVPPPMSTQNGMTASTSTNRIAPIAVDSQGFNQGTTTSQQVIQGNQPGFGQRMWEWMNPGREQMSVTTLPVTTTSESMIVSGGTGYKGGEGPVLVGPETVEYSHGLFGHPGWLDGGRCGEQPKFFLSAEVLLWFINGQEVPALVTQGSVADARAGALGQPGTQVLFGGGNLQNDFAAGGRFTAGYWFGSQNIIGVDAQYFFLGQVANNYVYQGFGNTQTVGRPFVNALNNVQQVEQVYQPAIHPNPQGNSVAGSVTVHTQEQFDGATANLRWGLIRRPRWTTDIQTGFRWQQFNEQLGIVENLADTSANARGGFIVSDQFQTFNNFYGGNFSALNTLQLGRWSLGFNGKLGVGITNQSATINGYTLINENGVVNAYPGGLLAQKSNMGTYNQSVFTVVPEMDINVGFLLSERIRFTVGYNLIYWSNVARPGALIDPVVNPNQLPPPTTVTGPMRPAFNWNNQDLWITGANIGLEYKY